MRHSDITEARDLEWYFSVGISAFERSPTGGMLDRAALLAVPRPPPPRRVNGQFTGETVEAITAQPIRGAAPRHTACCSRTSRASSDAIATCGAR
jgi:hypothetical protein